MTYMTYYVVVKCYYIFNRSNKLQKGFYGINR